MGGGEIPACDRRNLKEALAEIEIGGRGNGAVEGIASTGAQVSDVNGERGSACNPPGVTTSPDGNTFVPGTRRTCHDQQTRASHLVASSVQLTALRV